MRHGHITDQTIAERIAVGIPEDLAPLSMATIVYATGVPANHWNWLLRKHRGQR
jgi:hypothetical protein